MEIVKVLFVAIFGKLAAEEAKAWLPRFSQELLRYAVSWLPEDLRGRYHEEWRADLESYPGEISRVSRALGLVIAGMKMDSSFANSLRAAFEFFWKRNRGRLDRRAKEPAMSFLVMLGAGCVSVCSNLGPLFPVAQTRS